MTDRILIEKLFGVENARNAHACVLQKTVGKLGGMEFTLSTAYHIELGWWVNVYTPETLLKYHVFHGDYNEPPPNLPQIIWTVMATAAHLPNDARWCSKLTARNYPHLYRSRG